MKPSLRVLPLAALLLAAACDSKTEAPTETIPQPKPAKTEKPAAGDDVAKPPTPAKREMPKFTALTETAARAILHASLENLGGDDESRRALLYLADLGDSAGLDAAKKLVAVENGKLTADIHLAAIGAEALLAYGDADGAAKALLVAKQYEAESEAADEYLVRALGRVQGAERAAAAAELLKIAQSDDDPDDVVAAVAAGELARSSTPSATEAFAKIAADTTMGAQRRGAALAGLLHAGDSRAKSLAERVVTAATAPEPDEPVAPDGKTAPDKPAPESDAPSPDELLVGLGVEGATEAAPYVKRTMENLLQEDTPGFAGRETAMALVRIYAKGGGKELVPWLREWAKRDDGFHENEASLAALALGDDESAAVVAKNLQDEVARWSTPMDWTDAIDILDVVARRGVAGSSAFREVVESAAQVKPSIGGGTNTDLTELNLAAAHAFLKATKK